MRLFKRKNKITKGPGYWNNYETWGQALKDSKGYDSDTIIEKVKTASLQVKNGDAVYERDSVIFDEVHYSWPIVSSLLLSAINNNNELRILDFGGALGSSFFAYKNFSSNYIKIKWGIVEQEKFVNIGNEHFASSELSFYKNLESGVNEIKPNVLLLSSTLPYIKNPYKLLSEIFQYSIQNILIDRTPVLMEHNDRITLQIVPKEIYDASYPAWFFNEDKLITTFKNESYNLISEFKGIAEDIVLEDCISKEKGYIFKKYK